MVRPKPRRHVPIAALVVVVGLSAMQPRSLRSPEISVAQLERQIHELKSENDRLRTLGAHAPSDEVADEDKEFPYPLTCPKFDPRSVNRSHSVALGYHIGMLNNWKTIVKDQLRTLDRCGLGSTASHLILSYSNGNVTEILDLIESLGFDFNVTLVHSVRAPWEAPAVNAMRDFCIDRVRHRGAGQHPTVMFYFHNKGASKYTPRWQEQRNRPYSYAMSLYWRKYLEYFTLERPRICIDRIVRRNASTCAANLHEFGNHYSGTFWSASCEYLSSLRALNMSSQEDTNYVSAEMWIGQKMTSDREKFVNLHYHRGFNLYENLVLPEQYSDFAWRWQKETYTEIF